ncbi:alpha/beta fold hydrolase [Microbispora sp. ZYX-F-249]|uniref:Alpha/beta fold hydrolase n=1 Tax=Microbispora maris TaxID=3144104 RepID=A0ABV0AU53_9ACTN
MPLASSNGYKIHYEVRGDGPPLVLHPGMFGTAASWARAGYTGVLARSHRVIAIDPLGMGGSDAPRDPAAYTSRRRAEYVAAVLDDAGVGRAVFWGYSLGALTGYAVLRHAPQRCAGLVAGSYDPVDGFGSALGHALRTLGLPADTDVFGLLRQGAYADPEQAAVIDAGDEEAFRANFAAFSPERGFDTVLTAAEVPLLLYCGTGDPWHEPMREVAGRAGAGFFPVPGADHQAGWTRSADVLPHVLRFLNG